MTPENTHFIFIVFAVHSCLELSIPFPMSTNNPSWKSVVLKASAKPSVCCQFGIPGLVLQKIQESLTQGENLLGAVGVKCVRLTIKPLLVYTNRHEKSNTEQLHYIANTTAHLLGS